MERIAEWLQRQLSTLIQQEIKDPRLPDLITISVVNVSADLSHARVYFTALTDNKDQVVLILNNAAGYLRNILAKISPLYKVPQLYFMYDDSMEYSLYLSNLIRKL